MRIVFVTTKLNFITSGASVQELDIKIRTLIELGHEVMVVTMFSSANNIPELLPYKVIEEKWSGSQLKTQWGTYRMLKKYESQTDVFFIDGQVFLYGAGLYRLLGGKRPVCAHFNRELQAWPEFVSSLFGVPRKNPLLKIKQKIRFYIEKIFFIPFANHIDAASFTNPYLQKTYKDFGFSPRISFVAGDAFDYIGFMHRYDVTEDSYRTHLKRTGPYTIYYSSRMAPGKGFDTLIVAFSKLKNKNDYRLVLGGAGPEEQNMKELVHTLGLEEYVTYTGWAPKVEHYKRLRDITDIFVQPSQSGLDKTSYILLESMAFGIPSVLPGGGGLEWDAKDSAIYFKAGDTNDLAGKIEKLGNDHELRSALSVKAYERLKEEEMDYHSQVSMWEKKIHQLLETK